MIPEQNMKNDIYKELANRLKTGEDTDEAYNEINELCANCRPSSPVMCMELCQIWKLKRDYHDTLEAVAKKPSPINVLNTVKDEKRLKILGVLSEKPLSLKELEHEFHNATLGGSHLKPLMDAGLIHEENNCYGITATGRNAYNILTQSSATHIPLDCGEDEERILEALLSGPKTHDDLLRALPSITLTQSIEKLCQRGLVAQPDPEGEVLYYKTKRRPTRKLSETELKIFKALPKEGITIRDLSAKIGISEEELQRDLRILRFKRHAKRTEKVAFYELTSAGRDLAESLNVAYSLLQS